MRPILLVDCDEVLADFVTPAIEVLTNVLGRPWSLDEAPMDDWDIFGFLTPEQKTEVFVQTGSPGFCSKLEPLPRAQDFIRKARESCDVYAVTAPQHRSPSWVFERTEWLAHHFEFDRRHVVHTDAKYLCAGHFFLDDNPGHVTRWQAQHTQGQAMLWSTPHNKRLKGFDAVRVHSWEEVLRRVSGVGATR